MKNKSKIIKIVLLGMVIIVIAVSFFLKKSSVALVKDTQEKIEAIDLGKNYQVKTLNNEKFLDHMTDGGGQVVGYFNEGEVVKITEKLGLSYGVKTYEYYFENENLILVKEKEEDFPDPDKTGTLDYSKVEEVFDGQYYFSNDRLIYAKVTGKKKFTEGVSGDDYSTFLNFAKQNIELLKTSQGN